MFLAAIAGGVVVVAGYFVYQWVILQMGPVTAAKEIPFNVMQALSGLVGVPVYVLVARAYPPLVLWAHPSRQGDRPSHRTRSARRSAFADSRNRANHRIVIAIHEVSWIPAPRRLILSCRAVPCATPGSEGCQRRTDEPHATADRALPRREP